MPAAPIRAAFSSANRPRPLRANRPALDLAVPSGRLPDIVDGRRAIAADTAGRCGRCFDNAARFRLDLQAPYDIAVVERDHGAGIAGRLRPADAV